MTPFDDWLQQLAAAKKGPWPIPIHRGLPFEYVIALEGNWTGSTLIGGLRLSPDAPDPVLVSFTVTGPVVVASVSTFTLSLTKVQTAALPSDAEADGVVELVYDLLFTPSGGTQQRLFGGVANLIGKVTNGS